MTLSEKIEGEIKTALKAREAEKLSALRMLKSAVGAAAIKKGKEGLDDSEVIEVIGKLCKQHEESMAAFEKGGRPDLAQ